MHQLDGKLAVENKQARAVPVGIEVGSIVLLLELPAWLCTKIAVHPRVTGLELGTGRIIKLSLECLFHLHEKILKSGPILP